MPRPDPLPDRTEPLAHPSAAATAELDVVPVAVLMFADDAVVAANSEWTALTGLTTTATRGTGWLDAIYVDDRPKACDLLHASDESNTIGTGTSGSSPAPSTSSRSTP